jgi:hypothetical protein
MLYGLFALGNSDLRYLEASVVVCRWFELQHSSLAIGGIAYLY